MLSIIPPDRGLSSLHLVTCLQRACLPSPDKSSKIIIIHLLSDTFNKKAGVTDYAS